MQPLTVYFDGECPICKFEVAFYERRDRLSLLDWKDITTLSSDQLPRGKSRDDLLGKFHALEQDGRWHVGVDAFDAIWRRLPLFSHFAWLFRTPIIRQIANLAYRGFLAWQQRDRRRRRQQRHRREQLAAQVGKTSD